MQTRITIIMACCFTAVLAFAQIEEEDFSQGLLDREEAIEVASGLSTHEYPDAEEILVDGIHRIRYKADGTYTMWHEEYTKILTEEARRSHQTLSSYFTIPYQRGPEDCAVVRVEIIKPDGTAVPIDVEANSRIMINPSSMSQNIYNPNDKIIQVSIPGLEIGDVLHTIMFDRIVKPRMTDTWYGWYVFEQPRPIIRSRIDIIAPEQRPILSRVLKAKIGTTVEAEENTGEGEIYYRWVARNVPRMFPEPGMPPPHTVVQRLLVSTAPDWEYVSKWYWNLSAPHLETTPDIDAEVERLTAGLSTDREKIEALFRFVSNRIRYMGIIAEANAPGYEPHDVSITFTDRFGVCRDKAALLVAMLRQAGFDAFPALISTGPKKDPEVPQPSFDHAIVAVRQADGHYLLMDPTDENTTELLPAYLSNKSYLVASPEGETLRTSPIIPATNNLMTVTTAGTIDTNGNLSAETTLDFGGVNDSIYRNWFARNKPEDRKSFFEGLVKRADANARMTDLDVTPANMQDVNTNLSVRLTYEADDVLIAGEDATMAPLPTIGTRVGLVNFIINETGLKERKYPLMTEMACGVRESISIAFESVPGPAESLPSGIPRDTTNLAWSLQSTITGNVLRMESSFLLKAVEFEPVQYLALRDCLKQVEQDLRKMPVFARRDSKPPESDSFGADADAVIISEEVHYELLDDATWTENRRVRKQINTFAGKKRNGELKLHYNSGWESIELEYAYVLRPDGTTQEVGEKETNLMDASWVGSAPRYPAGRILVLSFPALDIGSIIEYSYTRTCSNRLFFAAMEYFRRFDPIREKTVTVSVPADIEMDVLPLQAQGVTWTEELVAADVSRILFEAKAENMTRVQKEDWMPPWWTFNPTLIFSTGLWSEYVEQVGLACLAGTMRQDTAEKKAEELVADISSDSDRVIRIRDFVAEQIREAGPPLDDAPLSIITPADQTLKDGYGNSADRAVLLYTMLKAAGLSPKALLVSAQPDLPQVRTPIASAAVPVFFPNMLIELPGSILGTNLAGSIYLNDTDQYAELGTSPHEGKLSISFPDGDMYAVDPARPNGVDVVYEMDIQSNGTAIVTRRQWLRGESFTREKKRFAEMTPEERRRHFQEILAELSQAAEPMGELMADFDAYPGRIEVTARIPAYAVRADPYMYFSLPDSLAGLLRLRSDERINPLYLKQQKHVTLQVKATIPEGYTVDYLPPSVVEDDVAMSGIEIAYSSGERITDTGRVQVFVRGEAFLTPSIVSPSRYEKLLELDRDLSRRAAGMILLQQQAAQAEETLTGKTSSIEENAHPIP